MKKGKRTIVEEMDIIVTWDTDTDEMKTTIINPPDAATYKRMVLGAIYGLTREFYAVSGFKELQNKHGKGFNFDDLCRIVCNTLISYASDE